MKFPGNGNRPERCTFFHGFVKFLGQFHVGLLWKHGICRDCSLVGEMTNQWARDVGKAVQDTPCELDDHSISTELCCAEISFDLVHVVL